MGTIIWYPGCTNYVHSLGSGHIAEYMFQWCNLHRYSQQGREACNSLSKRFFSVAQLVEVSAGTKSKLKPIGKWLQCHVMLLCNLDIGLFIKQMGNDDVNTTSGNVDHAGDGDGAGIKDEEEYNSDDDNINS